MLCTGCGAKTQNAPALHDNYKNTYEIFVYSFADSNGDGIGDLKGVDEKLPYIKDMGFNAIWLMPVMPSPTYHKYDVIDYKNIDSEYGTLDDMKVLVEHAHENDINVIIDFVMNHSSSQNPWFINASGALQNIEKNLEVNEFYENGEADRFGSFDSQGNFVFSDEFSKENPEVTFYHFARKKIGGAYYPVRGTDSWYYEGSFWSEMPDLNFSSDFLKNEFMNIAEFWLKEMDIDGFRMDATMHFEEGNVSFNTEVMNWFYEYCKSINPDFYMVSEVWSSESTIASYYESKTDSMFNFDLADAEGKIVKAAQGKLKAAKLVNSMLTYETDFGSIYDYYIDAPFITNHDMGRVCNALQSDENALKFAGGLLSTMDGSAYVYYGEEIGLKSKGKKDENKRLPMVWSSNEKSSYQTNGPKDADSGIEQSFEGVEEQLKDSDSILNYYRKAFNLRNQYPAIARGKITIDDRFTDEHHALIKKSYIANEDYKDIKTGETDEILILYNTSPDEEYTFEFRGTEYESMSLLGFLTVDNSEIKKENGKISLPARSVAYMR